MSGQSPADKLSELSAAGRETLVSTFLRRTTPETDTASQAERSTDADTVAMSRRTYLAAAAGTASIAAVPTASAIESSGYGEDEYGLQAYGG